MRTIDTNRLNDSRPEEERARDRLPNPHILIGIGEFGHRVLSMVEEEADGFVELFGPQTVRNLATYRILSRDQLGKAKHQGFEGVREMRGGVHVDETPEKLARAFVDPTVKFSPGLDLGSQPRARTAHQGNAFLKQFTEDLCEMVATLFQVDRFVDYHRDTNRFVSRLDIYAVGQVDDPLSAVVHSAVQEAMSSLVASRLAPLFKERRANLSLTHMVSFPILQIEEPLKLARRLTASYGSTLSRLRKNQRAVAARFLFVEDRSNKYALKQSQMLALFNNYLRLLLFKRCDNDRMLLELVQPTRPMLRMAPDAAGISNICGSFTAASLEAPVPLLQRYCRNREAINTLNVFLGRAADGIVLEPEKIEPAWLAEIRERTYGPRGLLDESLGGELSKRIEELDAGRKARLGDRGLSGRWTSSYEEWEHHANLVEPFHGDLGPYGSPRFTKEGLKELAQRLNQFLLDLMRTSVGDVFLDLERHGDALLARTLVEEKERVDDLVEGSPAGWRSALFHLDRTIKLLRGRQKELADAIANSKLQQLTERDDLSRCRATLGQFIDEVDVKPLRKRFRPAFAFLGTTAGILVAALIGLAFPYTWAAGITWLALPLAVAGGFGGVWLADRHNRRIHEGLQELIWDSDDCQMQKGISEAIEGLTSFSDPDAFLGQRVRWTAKLWQLRFYNRLIAELDSDAGKLRDIHRVLDIQLEHFRADQEAIGLQYVLDAGIVREKTEGLTRNTDVFFQSLLSHEAFPAMYERFHEVPYAMAENYIVEHEPFKVWRMVLPFADYRELADYFLEPFIPLEQANFLDLPETRETAQQNLSEFLGDFGNKIEVQGERRVHAHERSQKEDKLILACPQMLEYVDREMPRLHWPAAWEKVDIYPYADGIHLLRHISQLPPWALESLGSELDLVKELVVLEDIATILALAKEVSASNLVVAMIATALSAMLRQPEEESQEESPTPSEQPEPSSEGEDRSLVPYIPEEWTEPAQELLRLCLDLRWDNERPRNGARILKPEEAMLVAQTLAGTPGLIELFVYLYAVQSEETCSSFSEANRRREMLNVAARGESPWVYRVLKALPEGWADPMVLSFIHADSVESLVLADRIDDALELLGGLRIQSTRASCLLRVAATLFRRKMPDAAAKFVDLATIPEADEHPPLPLEARPDYQDAILVAGEAKDKHKASVLLASNYGDVQGRAFDEGEDMPRGTLLLSLVEPDSVPKLLQLLEGYPIGFLDPGLLTQIRRRVV